MTNDIRSILAILNEQVLLEDPLAPILQGERGGKELLQMIRTHRVAYNNADFEEVHFSYFMSEDFTPGQVGIVVGQTGCATIRRRVGSVLVPYFIRGWEKKAKLRPEYFTATQTGQLLHLITNVKKCYVSKEPTPKDISLTMRRQNAADSYFDEEIATQRIFKKVKPVLIPIIRKSFFNVQKHFKDAIEAGDYQTAEMYSNAATKAKKFLVLIDRADSVDQLPGFVEDINYRTEFTKSIRLAFTDMHKEYAPIDLFPHPDDSAEEIENRKLYRDFLENAMSHIGKEVKYIIDRFRESCLTG